MNILFEGGRLNPIDKGEGTRNIALSYAKKLKEEGHNVVIITRRRNKNKTLSKKFETYEGIKFYRWTNSLHLLYLLKKIINKEKIDTINIFAKGSRPVSFMFYLKYFIRKPIIFNLFGCPFSKKYNNKSRNILALSLANKVLVSSKTICNLLKKDLKNIEYLPYGIDTKKFSPLKKTQNKKKIILCMRPPTESLFKAVENISKDQPLLLLLNKERKGKTFINFKNFKINVEFIGYEKNVSKIFNKADLCVDLQSKKEFIKSASPPLMILESMSCGVPILSTKIPEIEEIISDKIDGFLIKENNTTSLECKIRKALKDKKVSNRARKTILERYNLDKLIKKFLEKQKY